MNTPNNKNRILSFLLTKYENENTYLEYLNYLFDHYIVSFVETYNIDYNYKQFFSEFVSWIFYHTNINNITHYDELECGY